MINSLQFEQIQKDVDIFVCKNGGWQLSKNSGFHKCSSAHDYHVEWIECSGKWSLFINNYNFDFNRKLTSNNCIITVDTLFDVFQYICQNKYTHY